MSKWWIFSREGIADVEIVDIVWGRYRRCRNGEYSLRKVSQMSKCWKFSREGIAHVEMVDIL